MHSAFHSGPKTFADRRAAGRELGAHLARRYATTADLIVLGLPRGGVPVAYEVAVTLDAPLDVFVVRKLGAPFNPEFAIGAIASGGVTVYHEDTVAALGLDRTALERIEARERAELARRERAFRAERAPLSLDGKTVILVDDGIATGATMEAAVMAAKALRPRQVVVAVPTAARDSVQRLRSSADAVEVLSQPEPYIAVGAWYDHFSQTTDEEVVALLAARQAEVDAAR